MSIMRGNKMIAGVPIIDGALNSVSTRPLQNKVITEAINTINGRLDQIAPGSIYSKSEVDALLADKADTSVTYTKTEVDSIFAALYPIGSLYIGTQSTCPLLTIIPGSTWVLVAQDSSLQGSSNNHVAASTIEAGLPNINGQLNNVLIGSGGTGASGALSIKSQSSYAIRNDGTNEYQATIELDASRSSAIYGNSSTVQPPAYVVNVWRRTA